MRIIIAGSRTFNDYPLLVKRVDSLLLGLTDIEIVSGTAMGADRLGEKYANEKGYLLKQFPADWNRLGKSAGPIRNEQMAEYADMCIVFWDGESRGTSNMIENAEKHGLILKIIQYK